MIERNLFHEIFMIFNGVFFWIVKLTGDLISWYGIPYGNGWTFNAHRTADFASIDHRTLRVSHFDRYSYGFLTIPGRHGTLTGSITNILVLGYVLKWFMPLHGNFSKTNMWLYKPVNLGISYFPTSIFFNIYFVFFWGGRGKPYNKSRVTPKRQNSFSRMWTRCCFLHNGGCYTMNLQPWPVNAWLADDFPLSQPM
jgi:hypothetical protein